MCSLSVVFSSLRLEVIKRYQYTQTLPPESWTSIFGPLFILIAIPLCIVIARAIRTMTVYRSVPLHVVKMQIGRVLYFFGLTITVILLYCITIKTISISDGVALLPFLLGWVLSIPFIIQRVQGVCV